MNFNELVNFILTEAKSHLSKKAVSKKVSKHSEDDEFTFKIAKAAEKGEKTTKIGGKKVPVKMSKQQAAKITGKKKAK